MSKKQNFFFIKNRPTTNLELEKECRGITDFRGVFMRDRLPKKPRNNESAIVNLNKDSEEGSHWVAYRKKK